MAQLPSIGQASAGGLRAAWVTDTGPVALSNQDTCLAAPEAGLFIVSDGMGGEHAGDLASYIVVDLAPGLVHQHLSRLKDPDTRAVELALRQAVVELNHRLREECSRLALVGKMGATLAMALVRGPHAHVAHMGDSRVYMLCDGKLVQLTEDHSVAAVLLRRGAITPQQAAVHPMRTHLSRYVGMGGNAYADVRTEQLRPGDRLLLCTDGLTEVLSNDQIALLLGGGRDVQQACSALVNAAKGARSRDNITVLIAERSAEAAAPSSD